MAIPMVRQKVRRKLRALFPQPELEYLAEHIEVCIYNYTVRSCRRDRIGLYWKEPKFTYRYTTKALSILFNLQNPKNPGCLQRMVCGDMGPKKLVGAYPSELFPEMWDVVFERVAAKQLRKQLTVDIDSVPDSSQHQCGKCRSRKTMFTQLQTRSADEPMSTFVVCLNCQTRWKY